jgi:hypothetical protein
MPPKFSDEDQDLLYTIKTMPGTWMEVMKTYNRLSKMRRTQDSLKTQWRHMNKKGIGKRASKCRYDEVRRCMESQQRKSTGSASETFLYHSVAN